MLRAVTCHQKGALLSIISAKLGASDHPITHRGPVRRSAPRAPPPRPGRRRMSPPPAGLLRSPPPPPRQRQRVCVGKPKTRGEKKNATMGIQTGDMINWLCTLMTFLIGTALQTACTNQKHRRNRKVENRKLEERKKYHYGHTNGGNDKLVVHLDGFLLNRDCVTNGLYQPETPTDSFDTHPTGTWARRTKHVRRPRFGAPHNPSAKLCACTPVTSPIALIHK